MAVFGRGATLVKAGDTVVNKPLAATLRRIASEGAKAFYEGPIATEIVSKARAVGSNISEVDLATYRPVERTPLRRAWEGYDIATMPSPSAGGVMLLETLGMFSKADLVKMGHNSSLYQHMVAEAMRGATADRVRVIGDPAFATDKTVAMLDPTELKARRARIDPDRTHAPTRFDLQESGTSHLVIADERGNVVSLTTTVNTPFGSGIVTDSGVVLNDELSDFTQGKLATLFGQNDGGPNRPRPLARPVSSMTPTLVFRGGALVMATGGSGGIRIANNVTQAVLNHLAFGMNAKQAISAPRFFTPPTGPILSYPADQAPAASVQRDLVSRGEQIEVSKWQDLTGVQMLVVHREGNGMRFEVAGDPRKAAVGIVE
jgi:gamma-glutamyltranspeptidase/glutathione hydrolase